MMVTGTVRMYFQLFSHHKCMKNKITSIALAVEIAIIAVQPVVGFSIRCEFATQNDIAVSANNITKTIAKNGLRSFVAWTTASVSDV